MKLTTKQFKLLLHNINLEIANTIDEFDLKKILNKSLIDFKGE